MLTLPMFRGILRTSQTKDSGAGCRPYFVVGGKISVNLNLNLPRLYHLMKVLPKSPTDGFQLGTLNQPSALVSDDDCREAVSDLNKWRLYRAEILEEGYDVSDIICYDIY
jgi:hypothetical protein